MQHDLRPIPPTGNGMGRSFFRDTLPGAGIP